MFGDLIHFGDYISYGELLLRVLLTVVIGAAIGIDREVKSRPAGMRTHVLVCLGAMLVALVEQQTVAYVARLGNSQINVSVGRLTAGVVSGVGFLGAGTIIMSDRKIMGLTTAASLWCTACLGLAVGAGFSTMAVLVGVVILSVLRLMQRIVHIKTFKRLEVQFVHRTDTLAFLNDYFTKMNVKVLDVDFHCETRKEGNLYTNIYTLSMPNSTSYVDIIGTLSEHSNIRTVRTRNL